MYENIPMPIQLAVLTVLVGGLFLIIRIAPPLPAGTPNPAPSQVSASAASSLEATTTLPSDTTTVAEPIADKPDAPADAAEEPSVVSEPVKTENPNQVRRVENPYPTAPLTFETVNVMARAALVNIFCATNNGLMRPISGSGVFIDPRGVILTNAHVAQYVLLAESGQVNLQCQIRAGSPAVAKWRPHVVYVPPVWIDEHAADLTKERPLGTGRHDYALILAGASLDGTQRPTVFPYLTPDTREAIGFVDDTVLTASYPAEFLGSITASFNLYHVTSLTRIDELFTLGSTTADVMSIGSVIGAQSGSSGGVIANAWGRLIGVITTTSDGNTTGERRLRGIALSYINRDIAVQSGKTLADFLAVDPQMSALQFSANIAPGLVDTLVAQIK